MKRAFFAIFVGALLLWFSVVPSTPANADEPEEGHLLINEVALATLDANARWFEVYNPTNDTISLHNWTYYFSGCYAVFNFPNIAIEPLLYATITPSIENFTNYWEVSDLDEVYQGMVPYESPTYMWIVDGDGEIVDDMGEPSTYVLNESWARYRDALDTNNFTNDFYIEPNPTPGYENNLAKGETNQTDGSTTPAPSALDDIYLVLVGVIAVAGVAAVAYIAHRRRRGVPPET